MTFLSRLNYTGTGFNNFPNTNFGQAIDPNGNLNNRLSQQSTIPALKDWQYNAAVNSDTSLGTWFQNPVSAVATNLVSLANTINNRLEGYASNCDEFGCLYPFAGMFTTYYSNINSVVNSGAGSFIQHTNRMSNISTPTGDLSVVNYPDFNKANALSRSVQLLVFQNETTSTSILGAIELSCFTSLFIGSDLTNYYNSSNYTYSLLDAYLTANPELAAPDTTSNNYITSLQSDISNASNLMNDRKNGDINFYNSLQSIISDVGFVRKLSSSTYNASELYLIENYIGTPNLTNNI